MVPIDCVRRIRVGSSWLALAAIGTLAGAILGAQAVSAQVSVLTYHNDNSRTGQNLSETILTPANVVAGTFGRLFSYTVDGQVFAPPLYLPKVTIGGHAHNVVFVATMHDSVYAFDADSSAAGLLWQTSFINPAAGVTTVPSDETGGGELFPETGVFGTPVLDPSTGTLYAVAATKEIVAGTVHYVQRLHALDVTTGAEKFGGPVVIGDTVPNSGGGYTYVSGVSVPGSGDGGTRVIFNAFRESQRPALLLLNGVVYIAWASHNDVADLWHGWVIGYNAQTLQVAAVFNATPNANRAGIWMAGDGPYAVSGSQSPAYGDSVLKLSTTSGLAVADSFTPWNQASLAQNDHDLASGGVLLLPDQPGPTPHLLVAAGKEGAIYLINRDHLGGYQQCGASCDAVVQELPTYTLGGGSWDTPAYFNGWIYYQSPDGALTAWQLSNGLLPTSPVSKSSTTIGFPGATPSISANGSSNGIAWTVQTDAYDTGGPAVLHAYDAGNLSTELYNSTQVTADNLGASAKFTVPTIANGKVYVGTASSLAVFGLLAAPAQPTLAVVRAGTGSGTVTSSPAGINCGTTCSASFASGTAVTLTATPATGSTFSGWSGGGCSGTGTCTVTLTANTTVTATFGTSSGGGGSGPVNVVWITVVNATANGNSLQKTSGCDGCADAGGVSQQQIASGDGYLEFTATETTTYRIAGLSNVNNTAAGEAGIDLGIYLEPGDAQVREDGTWKAQVALAAGDVFRVAIVSGVVTYYRNGTVFYTSTAVPKYPLQGKASLWSLKSTITNAVFLP